MAATLLFVAIAVAGVRDIAPVGGRLLLFNSCEMEHEVLPTIHSRMAVTLWAFAAGGLGETQDPAPI